MSGNRLLKCDLIKQGEFLESKNKQFKAVLQDDGNFVIYGWKPLWASDTWGNPTADRLVMQDDCNLVIYKKDDEPMWQSNTQHPGDCKTCRLTLQDDGHLVIEREGKQIWSSASSKGVK
ncbi:LEC protein, partial [Amia calva]|nr:LEC protein [Amia calva]